MRQIFILMVVLALASPVFGQTADTPPPYDVTTAVGYPLDSGFMQRPLGA